ncbi:hypothetical protein GCM10023159_28550 [Brevibacterium yomogidense]
MIDVEALAVSAADPVFGPLDVTLEPGGTLVVVGPAGSGKTALLLTLTGRMRATAGSGTVIGADVRSEHARIRSESSLAWVEGITDLDKDYTVEQHVAERLIGLQPWYRPVVGRDRVQRALETADIGRDLPAQAFVADLTQLQRFELELLLAWLDGSAIIALDNIDFLREPADRRHAWRLLREAQESVARALPDRLLSLIVTCEDDSGLPARDDEDGIVRVTLRGSGRLPAVPEDPPTVPEDLPAVPEDPPAAPEGPPTAEGPPTVPEDPPAAAEDEPRGGRH